MVVLSVVFDKGYSFHQCGGEKEKVRATKLLCVAAVIAATLYDIIALCFFGVDGSISHWLAAFSAYPVPVFGVGFLCGHFFGNMYPIMPIGQRTELERLSADIRATSVSMGVVPAWADRLDKILGDKK